MTEAGTLARTRPRLVELGDLAGLGFDGVADRFAGGRGDDRGGVV